MSTSRALSLFDTSASLSSLWPAASIETNSATSFSHDIVDLSATGTVAVSDTLFPETTIITIATPSSGGTPPPSVEPDADDRGSFEPISVPVMLCSKPQFNGDFDMTPGTATILKNVPGISAYAPMILSVPPSLFGSPSFVNPSSLCAVVFHDQASLDLHEGDLPPGLGGTFIHREIKYGVLQEQLHMHPPQCLPIWIQHYKQAEDIVYAVIAEVWERVKTEFYAHVTVWAFNLVWDGVRFRLMGPRIQRPEANVA